MALEVFVLRIDPAMHKQLEKVAKQMHMTTAGAARQAIYEWLVVKAPLALMEQKGGK
jgi:predicted transcriptional regulator